MEFIKDLLGTFVVLFGIFWILYFGAYIVELGKIKARHKLKVCDTCFKKVEAMQKVEDESNP